MKLFKNLPLAIIILLLFLSGCTYSSSLNDVECMGNEKSAAYPNFNDSSEEAGNKDAPSEISGDNQSKIDEGFKVDMESSQVKFPAEPPPKISEKILGKKIVFLTFDDGPSNLTPQFLDVLKENDVHATFCVIGKRAENYSEIIKRAYQEGHSIINHSYDHVLKKIYSSAESFIVSIEKTNEILDSIIDREDIERSFLRFPGGAKKSYSSIAALLKSEGYNTLDWNIDSGDCKTGMATKDYIRDRAVKSENKDVIVILMHDFKYRKTTLLALPEIIKYYKDKGYVFRTIRDMSSGDLKRLEDKKIVNVLY